MNLMSQYFASKMESAMVRGRLNVRFGVRASYTFLKCLFARNRAFDQTAHILVVSYLWGKSAYPTELLARSTRRHCAQPAAAMPITLMTAPRVITLRRANELRKAKQLSGTATASNKSRFMAKCVCLWLRGPT
jgi:hypothetical protein